MRTGCAASILVCLLAVVSTTGIDSAMQPELQEYHSVPDWIKPPLQSAFLAESEKSLHSAVLPLARRPLPSEVAVTIHSTAEECYRAYIQANEAGSGYLPMASFYGPVFCLEAPDTRNLYTFTLYDRGHRDESEKWFYLLLSDPESGKATRNCVSIQAKHMGSELFYGHLVHFFDVNLDGRTELVVQEIVHNGIMYNAAIYYYYRVTADMDLLPLFALEARVMDLFSDDRGMIVRTLERLGSNQIKINVALEEPAGTPNHRGLGTIVLEAKDSTSPFEVVEKSVRVARYTECLLTASGIDEQSFLREGYRSRHGERKIEKN